MNIAFITNNHEKCGVGQFGRSMAQALQSYSAHKVTVYSVDSEIELIREKEQICSADLILVNYHATTLPFFSSSYILKLQDRPILAVVHDYTYSELKMYSELSSMFRYRVLLNPAMVSHVPNVFSSPRIIPDIPVEYHKNDVFTVGSFGFDSYTKMYHEIISRIEDAYDEAHIKFHIPFAHFGDQDGGNARRVTEECRSAVKKKGIRLTVSHEFMPLDSLIGDFLAKNDLNFFCYKQTDTGGISSTIDMAIAAERPIALSNSNMFRHIKYYAPEFFIDNNTPDSIMQLGEEKVRFLKELWSPKNAAKRYDEIFDFAMNDWKKPHIGKKNTILTDELRAHYKEHIDEIAQLSPVEFARKIPAANIQQAFVKANVEKYAPDGGRILSVGCFDDTAFTTLQKKDYCVEGIDPALNRDLNEHFKFWNNTQPYTVIFSTSVIEHVENDEEFIEKISAMLALGGHAILTMDFKNDQSPSDPVISGNYRFYTSAYILEYLVPRMHFCELVDCYDWDEYPSDFTLGEYNYSFATLVFRKKTVLSHLDLVYTEEIKGLLKQRSILQEKAVDLSLDTNGNYLQRVKKGIAKKLPPEVKSRIKKLLYIPS